MRSVKIALVILMACNLYFTTLYASGNPGSLARVESQISALFTRMAASKADADKQRINDSIVQMMGDAVQLPGSMEYPFAQLTRMGRISSGDGRIRIYTWNVPRTDGTNMYYGYLQYTTGKKGESSQVFLNDKSSDIRNAHLAVLSPSQWYGMLVYEIVETKDGGNVYYTLLGLDNQDLFVSCKIADVLYFDDHNLPVFGKSIFNYRNNLVCRVIFQYSAKVKMGLKWNNKMKMIIFDHLAPPNSSYKDNYAFYGPDFSYDGFRFEKGRWELVEKVDVRNRDEGRGTRD